MLKILLRSSPTLHSLLSTPHNLRKIQGHIQEHKASIQAKNKTGITFFENAILKNRWDVIKWLVHTLQASKSRPRNRSLISEIQDEITKLFYSSQSTEIIQHLVDSGHLEPYTRLNKNLTPLHLAYQTKQWELFDLLLDRYTAKRSETTQYDDFLSELLYLSLEEGDFSTAQLFLEKKANPNFIKHKKSALELAFEAEFTLTEIEYLLQKGANPNIDFSNQSNPLHTAYHHQQFDRLALLLRYRADINFQSADQLGNTLLHLAVQGKSLKQIEWFLACKADPNIKNNEGLTPLQLVMQDCRLGIPWDKIELLIKAGATPDIRVGTDTLLTLALKEKKWEMFEHILGATAFKAPELELGNLLHELYYNDQIDLIAKLLEKGANPNNRDINNRRCLLHTAIHEDRIAVIEMLLEKGADASIRYPDTTITPLYKAFRENNWHIVQALAPYSPPLNHWDSLGFSTSTPPLVTAVKANQWELARVLLEHNEGMLDTKHWTYSPYLLPAAINHEQYSIAMVLLEKGISPNMVIKEGNSALHIALSKNTPTQLIKLLLEKGSNPNQKNAFGDTPFHLALYEKGNEHAIQLLLEEGANPDILDAENFNALHLAIDQGRNLAIIQSILDKTTNPHQKDVYGDTPLHTALYEKDNDDIIQLLLEKGIDPNISDADGFTALHLAIDQDRDQSLIENLLKKGANPNCFNDAHDTPLMLAFKKGNLPILKLLLAHKGDINILDNNGDTLLHKLISEPVNSEPLLTKMVNVLLRHGADPDRENKAKKTALALAIENQQWGVVGLLLDKGAKNPYSNDFALLYKLASNQQLNILRDLILKGFNPNPIKEILLKKGPLSSITLLHTLLREKNISAAEVILQTGSEFPAFFSTLSQFIQNNHWDAVKLLLKYRDKLGISKNNIPNGGKLLYHAFHMQDWELAEHCLKMGIPLKLNYHHGDILKALYKATNKAQEEGYNPIEKDNIKFIQCWIEKGENTKEIAIIEANTLKMIEKTTQDNHITISEWLFSDSETVVEATSTPPSLSNSPNQTPTLSPVSSPSHFNSFFQEIKSFRLSDFGISARESNANNNTVEMESPKHKITQFYTQCEEALKTLNDGDEKQFKNSI
jgi:ankyrin repeat protein